MMTDEHLELAIRGQPVVYQNGTLFCSVCAPISTTQAEIEDFAMREFPPEAGAWEAIDKSRLGLGQPTPNACNQRSDRRHWFLMAVSP